MVTFVQPAGNVVDASIMGFSTGRYIVQIVMSRENSAGVFGSTKSDFSFDLMGGKNVFEWEPLAE